MVKSSTHWNCPRETFFLAAAREHCLTRSPMICMWADTNGFKARRQVLDFSARAAQDNQSRKVTDHSCLNTGIFPSRRRAPIRQSHLETSKSAMSIPLLRVCKTGNFAQVVAAVANIVLAYWIVVVHYLSRANDYKKDSDVEVLEMRA